MILLPLTSADLDEASALFADPRVMDLIDGGTRSRAATSNLLSANERCWKAEGWGLWAIRDAESGAFLGQGGLQRITDFPDATAEFSMILGRRNWRDGYGTEAGNAILFDAWGRLDGHAIHALLHPDNTAGSALLRKLGMQRGNDEIGRGETLQVWMTHRLA